MQHKVSKIREMTNDILLIIIFNFIGKKNKQLSLMQTEKSQSSGQWIMSETR